MSQPSGAGCCPIARHFFAARSPPPPAWRHCRSAICDAVAAAAGCSLSQPFPDNGIDWHVSHSAPGHTVDDEVTVKVQLKATYQVAPNPARASFSLHLDNAHLRKLARTPVSVHKILVVMLVPRSRDDWLRAGHDRLDLRHCCYWTNLAGHSVAPAGTGPPYGYRPRASSTTRASARS